LLFEKLKNITDLGRLCRSPRPGIRLGTFCKRVCRLLCVKELSRHKLALLQQGKLFHGFLDVVAGKR
jgi:hypothetical protein